MCLHDCLHAHSNGETHTPHQCRHTCSWQQRGLFSHTSHVLQTFRDSCNSVKLPHVASKLGELHGISRGHDRSTAHQLKGGKLKRDGGTKQGLQDILQSPPTHMQSPCACQCSCLALSPKKVEEMWKGPDPGMSAKVTPHSSGKAPEMTQKQGARSGTTQVSPRMPARMLGGKLGLC